ncbi:MAG: dihydropteroate synthase [Chitinophagales bacterium]|jgi:dihydropteroate synthase
MPNNSSYVGRIAPDFHCGTVLDCGGKLLSFKNPSIMGVLNVTPDSFSDGGRYIDGDKLVVSRAVDAALLMVEQGAQIIDIGGESTRPGAAVVSVSQELDRVIPVVEALAAQTNAIISVDTSSAQVMLDAASNGAGIINDVRALARDGALAAAKQTGLPVCLMHMQGLPATMQDEPQYQDVNTEVAAYLLSRVDACVKAGIDRSQLLLDPGFGFGKTLAHNLMLFNALPTLAALGYPLLVGVSRKSMLGAITGKGTDDRLAASVAMAALAAHNGASILRVHDITETADALAVVKALENYNNGP